MKKIHCPINKITPDDGFQYFFGYFDKCPWNRREDRLLVHRASILETFPTKDDSVDIGYIDLNNGSFIKISETTTWNWQQGSQLQWITPPGCDEEHIIFNKRVSESQVRACIVNIVSGQERYLEDSIYAVSSNADLALTLNYARLYDTRRDYGIAGLEDINTAVNIPENDGVWCVDIQSGGSKLILSMAEVANFHGKQMGVNTKHHLNHFLFNPSGNRFCFLHRFQRDDGITHSRFLTADIDGKNLRLLFEGIVSHYDWRDDNTILAWAGERKILGTSKTKPNLLMTFIRKSLKPIYYALGKPRILMQKIVGDCYWLLDDSNDLRHSKIAVGQLTCDGHCTYLPNHRWFLTDGYTDSQNKLPLFLWNVDKKEAIEVGRYATPKHLDNETRVDLHPRSNHSGTKICIDSAMDGSRGVYIVEIKELIGS